MTASHTTTVDSTEGDPIGQLAHALRIHHNGSFSSHGWPFVTTGVAMGTAL